MYPIPCVPRVGNKQKVEGPQRVWLARTIRAYAPTGLSRSWIVTSLREGGMEETLQIEDETSAGTVTRGGP